MARQHANVADAATVILLRPEGDPFEVLVVERRDRGFFGGLFVFPGGAVDPVDHSSLAREVVTGEQEDHAHRSAALRELAEETGLLAVGGDIRQAPRRRGEDLFAALRDTRQVLSGDSLTLVSRWVTPVGAPRRFDTRFYLLPVGECPPVRLDRHELVSHHWVTPSEALQRHREGQWPMVLPTVAHLRWLARRSGVPEALASAFGADGRTRVEPTIMEDGSVVPVHLPAEAT